MGWKYTSTAKGVKSALVKANAKATRETAKAIVKGAKSRAPVRTGALVASLYVVDGTPANTGGEKSGYEDAKRDAIAKNSHVAKQVSGEITLRPPEGVARCAVASAVDYSTRIEGGAYDTDTESYSGGRPFLKPSADAQEAPYNARVEAALRQVEARKKL